MKKLVALVSLIALASPLCALDTHASAFPKANRERIQKALSTVLQEDLNHAVTTLKKTFPRFYNSEIYNNKSKKGKALPLPILLLPKYRKCKKMLHDILNKKIMN